MEGKKKLHIEMDNLAVPEVQYDEEEKEKDEELGDSEHTIEIDYSGAVPEIHIIKKNK